MPMLTITDHGTHEVETGTRLVKAIEDAGVDILHRCGGYAKCTTCRVKFVSGESARMTEAEHLRLTATEQLGEYRLSCQIVVGDEDMELTPLMRLTDSGLADAGPTPADSITPEPEWRDAPQGEARASEDRPGG